jgi:hypothetical protein
LLQKTQEFQKEVKLGEDAVRFLRDYTIDVAPELKELMEEDKGDISWNDYVQHIFLDHMEYKRRTAGTTPP